MDRPGASQIALDTCYGDLFSVSWMENAEAADLTAETLQVAVAFDVMIRDVMIRFVIFSPNPTA